MKLFKSNCVCPHTYFQTNNKNNVLKIIVSVELVLSKVKNTMQFEILNLFLFQRVKLKSTLILIFVLSIWLD